MLLATVLASACDDSSEFTPEDEPVVFWIPDHAGPTLRAIAGLPPLRADHTFEEHTALTREHLAGVRQLEAPLFREHETSVAT